MSTPYYYIISSLPDFSQITKTEILESWVLQILENSNDEDRAALDCIFQRYDVLNLYHALVRSKLGIRVPSHRAHFSLAAEELLGAHHDGDSRAEFIQEFFHEYGNGDQLNPRQLGEAIYQHYWNAVQRNCSNELIQIFHLEMQLINNVLFYQFEKTNDKVFQIELKKDYQWLKPGIPPSDELEKEYPGITDLWKSLEKGQIEQQDDFLQQIIIDQAFDKAASSPYGSMHLMAHCFILLKAFRHAEIAEEIESHPLEVHLNGLLNSVDITA